MYSGLDLKSTPSSATTPGNSFRMSVISRDKAYDLLPSGIGSPGRDFTQGLPAFTFRKPYFPMN